MDRAYSNKKTKRSLRMRQGTPVGQQLTVLSDGMVRLKFSKQ